MLLAEALQERAAMQRKMSDLVKRAEAVALYQEGDRAPEDVNALLAEHAEVADKLSDLVVRINVTNLTAFTRPLADGGESLTHALARRDAMDQRLKALASVTSVASMDEGNHRYYRRSTRSELRDVTELDVKARRAEIDALSKTRRELDTEIQKANWNTELAS